MTDPHSEHFHARQADLLKRFRAIQQTLLAGYEATARDAERGMAAGDGFAPIRYAWATQAAAELRERMERDA